MINLTKKARVFLIITFLIGYVSFGYLVARGGTFSHVLSQPSLVLILVIGLLSPFIGGIITNTLMEKTSPLTQLKTLMHLGDTSKIYMVFLFLLMHYGFAIALHLIGDYGSISSLFTSLPIMILLLGLGEYGWRSILFPQLHSLMGFWRSNICVGLFMAVWLIPLLYLPGFLVNPNLFLPFAIYLIGIGILSNTIYIHSGSILYSVIFIGLFASLSSVIGLKVNGSLVVIALVDFVIGIAYNSKALNKVKLPNS